MTVKRRSVLKGMALSGIAGATAGAWTSAFAAGTSTASSAPLLALSSEGAAESVFLQAATAATGGKLPVQRVDRSPAFMLEFERLLHKSEPMHVIGMLDDAAATLVVDMARSAGAKLQWLGQHRIEAGLTHHHLLTADIAELCAQHFSHQLKSCGASVCVEAEQGNSIATSRRLVLPSSKDTRWAGSIGYLLASLAMPQPLGALPAPTTSMPGSGSFVSFSIIA